MSWFPGNQGDVDRITKHIAMTLRAARAAKGVTQEELAGRLDMATESISHIERAVTAPSLKTIAAAAEALDVSLIELFEGYDKQPAKTSRRAQNEATLRRFALNFDDRRLTLLVALAKAVNETG